MQLSEYRGLPRISIDPGESYVTRKEEMISTLLGSCVAACLYDPVNRVIGMNHFLLAHHHPAHKAALLASEDGRFGIHAMELLINQMLKQGAQRKNLKAKAFGGGDVLRIAHKLHGGKSIGAANCKFIKVFLNTERIPLMASCLGGDLGRHIFFMPDDFSVYVKNIEPAEEQVIIKKEQRFLKKNITVHSSQPSSQAVFW